MEVTEYKEEKRSLFLHNYIEQKEDVRSFYNYALDEAAYRQCYQDITEQTDTREHLINCMLDYHRPLTDTKAVYDNIEKLRDPKTVVVIGGQQAGLLTGPLLTIYKIMTIILDAKQKSEHLNVPVVPVFWIAGEDHDFDEINHVFVESLDGMKKKAWKTKGIQKPSMSQKKLNHDEMENWIEDIFVSFGETQHTVSLLNLVKHHLKQSETVSDFFAHLIMAFFAKYGLILYDSGSPLFKPLCVPFFAQLIENVEAVQKHFMLGTEKLEQAGYQKAVVTSKTSAHLFYYYKGSRMMLEYEADLFFIKNTDFSCTKEELLVLLKNNPEHFSNNVVTRPLMQEFLFPCLSFVAGPGELVYWAQIHPLFSLFQMKMPIVRPRMGITLLERNVLSYLDMFSLEVKDVFTSVYQDKKENLLRELTGHDIKKEMSSFYDQFSSFHQQLTQYVETIEPAYHDMMQKNYLILQDEIQFVEKKLRLRMEERISVERNRLRKIEHHLYPDGILQERIWNVFYFINRYGLDFVDHLMKLRYSDQFYHYFVKI